MAITSAFTDEQLEFLVDQRKAGAEYKLVAELLEQEFDIEKSVEAIRRAYNKYAHLFDTTTAIANIKVLQGVARTQKRSSQTAKENRTILAALNEQQDLLEQLKELIAELPATAAKVKAPKRDKTKRDMTVEALISDVHVGKKSDTFDIEVCRQRLRLYTTVLVADIERKQAHYNIERIIVAFLGDNIENALMHGRESTMACEFQNPEQVRYAIELFYTEVLVPLAQLGIPMDVVGIEGNHDRDHERKTFVQPGKNSLAWVIYHTLKMLTDRQGYKHVKWTIPEGVFTTLEVYGDTILYEHGDNVKGISRPALLAHIASRGAQLGKVVKGLRIGHYHEYTCFDNGRAITNASVCGPDGYSEVLGYNPIPGQVISYYVKTKNRDNSYYHSVLVQLGGAA